MNNKIEHLEFPARKRAEYAEAKVVKRVYRAPEAKDFDMKFNHEHSFNFFETEDGGTFLALGELSDAEFSRQVKTYCDLTDPSLSQGIEFYQENIRCYPAVIGIDADHFALNNFEEFERVIPVNSLSHEEQRQIRHSARPVKEIQVQ